MKMREIVSEANSRTKKLGEEMDRGRDGADKRISELFQFYKNHDDQLGKIRDDRGTFDKT